MRRYPVNIIDSDLHRRNRLARELYADSYHVEVCENVGEFLGMGLMAGVVLAWIGVEQRELASVIDRVIKAEGFYSVIAYSLEPSTGLVVDAMASGAQCVVDLAAGYDSLKDRLETVLDESSKRLEGAIEAVRVREKVATLSERELETLDCIVAGASIKQSARMLGLSPNTVRLHRSNLYFKLGATGLAQAVRMGIMAGIDPTAKRCSERSLYSTKPEAAPRLSQEPEWPLIEGSREGGMQRNRHDLSPRKHAPYSSDLN